MKLLTIIGARPKIIKAGAISRAVRGLFADRLEEKILHTGQHYDGNMSQIFFDELGIPQPDYNLGVGSGRHGEQTAKMTAGIEEVLLSEPFDGVILYGDTNSTLAAALAAVKLHIPVIHVEAGNRLGTLDNPEEIDRDFGYAEDAGINALRMFVSFEYWQEQPEEFFDRFEQVIALSKKHSIRIIWLFRT